MQENKYDDEAFFQKYGCLPRSQGGLKAAGEWHALRAMLPSLSGKKVLDLGCGYGWHCRYAAEQGAAQVTGVDISKKMLEKARQDTSFTNIRYVQSAIEEFTCPPASFDLVISSLALHYVQPYDQVCRSIKNALTPGGSFVFSVEHPVFTAEGSQDWHRGADGVKLHWPVDRYFTEGKRHTSFLGESVIKYHRTVTSYVTGLVQAGFMLTALVEPEPDPALLDEIPEMRDELRRPMMLMLSALA